MKTLLLPLFITGVVSVDAQNAVTYSALSRPNFNAKVSKSDRYCTQMNNTDSCLLPHNWLESINLYPSLFRQATSLLLPRWQSQYTQVPTQVPLVLSTESIQTKQKQFKQQTSPLKQPKFPSVSRSSLIVSAPNQKKINNQLLLEHPAPETKAITSPYGWRRRPYSGQIQFHKGIDYGAPFGSPVVAAKDGVVIKVVSGCTDFGNKWCGSQFGNWIEIDHGNGMIATYAHLRNKSIAIREGMQVKKNQPIATVGSSGWSTGAHLDFRLKVNGKYKNPKNFVVSKK